MEEDAHAVYSGVTVIVHHDMPPHNQIGTRLYCIPICVVNRTVLCTATTTKSTTLLFLHIN